MFETADLFSLTALFVLVGFLLLVLHILDPGIHTHSIDGKEMKAAFIRFPGYHVEEHPESIIRLQEWYVSYVGIPPPENDEESQARAVAQSLLQRGSPFENYQFLKCGGEYILYRKSYVEKRFSWLGYHRITPWRYSDEGR